MRGSTLRENRETLHPPTVMAPRAAMGSPRTEAIDERSGESHCHVVPTKPPNKGRTKRRPGDMANLNGHEGGNAGHSQGAPKEPGQGGKPFAEGVEGSGQAKGNAIPQNMLRTQGREGVPSARERIRQ